MAAMPDTLHSRMSISKISRRITRKHEMILFNMDSADHFLRAFFYNPWGFGNWNHSQQRRESHRSSDAMQLQYHWEHNRHVRQDQSYHGQDQRYGEVKPKFRIHLSCLRRLPQGARIQHKNMFQNVVLDKYFDHFMSCSARRMKTGVVIDSDDVRGGCHSRKRENRNTHNSLNLDNNFHWHRKKISG